MVGSRVLSPIAHKRLKLFLVKVSRCGPATLRCLHPTVCYCTHIPIVVASLNITSLSHCALVPACALSPHPRSAATPRPSTFMCLPSFPSTHTTQNRQYNISR
jgi:hypothetical protein